MRPESLKNKQAFDRVFDKGKRYRGELLTAVVAKAPGPAKLGIIVSHKYGGAVARNRIKRKIREAFRAATEKITGGMEFVVMPKEQSKRAKTPEILIDLSNIIHKADII
jgi:ribonuclease P protein component